MPEENKIVEGGNPLPDTIEEVPQSQHLAINYIAEESEGQPQEKETPPAQEESPEQKSFKYWQSEHDKKANELQQLKNQYQQDTQRYSDLQREIAQMREQLNPKPKEEILVEPQKPNTDDPNVILQWQTDYMIYNNKLLRKQQEEFQKANQVWQQELQRREQEELYARQKAYHLSQLQGTGLSPEEANEAFLMYSKAQETPEQYYKDLGDFYRYKKGQFATPRANNIDKRVIRQGEIPSLATVPSESENPEKVDDAKLFWNDMNDFIKKNNY